MIIFTKGQSVATKATQFFSRFIVSLSALLSFSVYAIVEQREVPLIDQTGCQVFYPQLINPGREPFAIRLHQAYGTCMDGYITGGIVMGVEATRPADGKRFLSVTAGLVGAGHFCGARLNVYEDNKQEFHLVETGGAIIWKGNKAAPAFELNNALSAVDEVATKVPCVRPDLVKSQLRRVVLAWNQDPLAFFEQYTTGPGGALPAVLPPVDDPKTVGRGMRGG